MFCDLCDLCGKIQDLTAKITKIAKQAASLMPHPDNYCDWCKFHRVFNDYNSALETNLQTDLRGLAVEAAVDEAFLVELVTRAQDAVHVEEVVTGEYG